MPHSILKGLPGNVRHFFSIPSINSLKNSIAQDNRINVSMLRLDEIHPIISGNKIFKLAYFLGDALHSKHKRVITFGGAFSNHLAATAWVCKLCGLQSIGIVRGERPVHPSETLLFCEQNGMRLDFILREQYKEMTSLQSTADLIEKYGDHALIPAGGFSKKGAEGAALISDFIPAGVYSHISVSVGTATTLAGLIKGTEKNSRIIGFPALKGLSDIEERLEICGVTDFSNLSLEKEYHFGGFGKKTPELIDFMNAFYETNKIPLDVVYTSKMMYGVYDLVKKKKFPENSNVLCIHTGGLQGNSSVRKLLHYH